MNKFYIFKTHTKCWTDKSCRQEIGIEPGDEVQIKFGEKAIMREVSKAPVEAARVLKSVHASAGLCGIGLTEEDFDELGADIGDQVEIFSIVQSQPKALAWASPASPVSPDEDPLQPKATLYDRMAGLEVDDVLDGLSASAVKSSVYGVAKRLDIKIKKESDTSIRRVS